ncbi:MAG: mechanosensitive ion channel, partial [Phycisphaerae bacterium]|nr:mechanosensitive ion channel [Fodinibius sp.]NIU57837.1 mechanosensitive ion channel [Phycisphaerae bacterium]NIV12477.1 mechanosensitive ion channel [Fodinibius sp.]NIW94275.1 mechanosensitive ion channel [Phycisphaerae bacterium]NIY26165.1 mechanosensitive ion channel [Fodinibius sp.]
MQDILKIIYEHITKYGLKIIGALVIFLIGKWLAGVVSRLVEKGLVKAHVEKTLAKFARHLTYVGVLIFVAIAALAAVDVETTQFAVVIGAAGLAIGLALQGSLANFASGFLMIIFRPFKVGDFIEAAGTKGIVKEVGIFNTIVNTPDNIRVFIPNAKLTGDNIMNYTVNGTRRVDLVVGISYEDDLKKAKQVIETVLAGDERVLEEPSPKVAVVEMGDSSVNFVVRPWVRSDEYWNAYFDITAKIKLSLDQNDITIPYPQRDIHIKNS